MITVIANTAKCIKLEDRERRQLNDVVLLLRLIEMFVAEEHRAPISTAIEAITAATALLAQPIPMVVVAADQRKAAAATAAAAAAPANALTDLLLLLLDAWAQFSFAYDEREGTRYAGGLSTLEAIRDCLTGHGLLDQWGRPTTHPLFDIPPREDST